MTKMDDYEILKPLGQGSFGKVFLVKHRATGEKLVMKQVPMPRARAEQEECLREAELMTKLQHPHCVGINACFLHGNVLCIVMEHCESGDLERVLKRTKQRGTFLPETIVLDILCELALCLEYLHNRKQRVLHRDLKAANVFLEKNEDAKENEPKYNVKLGDFGISRVLDASLLLANTQCGTPCYMAPELYRGTPYGDKADMWSLGILAYELCALKLPFNGTSMADLGNRVMKTQPAMLPGKYTAPLRALVSSLLEKDPKKRPSAADILRNDLVRDRVSVIVNFDRATTSSNSGSPPATGPLAPSPPPDSVLGNVAVARRAAPRSARRSAAQMAAPAKRLPTPLNEEQRSAAIAQGLEAQAMRVGISPPASPPASPSSASPPTKLPALAGDGHSRRPAACGRRASPPPSPTPPAPTPAPSAPAPRAPSARAPPAAPVAAPSAPAGKPSGVAPLNKAHPGRPQAQVYPGLEGGPGRRVHQHQQHNLNGQQARPIWIQEGPVPAAGQGAEQRGINEILAANARGVGAAPRDHRGMAGYGAAGALYAMGGQQQQQQQHYRRAVGAPLPGGWRAVPVY